MIINIWRPKTKSIDKKQVIIYHTLCDIIEMYNTGSSTLKVIYKCDNKNCKNPERLYSIGRHHLNSKRSKTVNENIQICKSCQTTGENNPKYRDNRTWEEIMGKEKSDIMKSVYSDKWILDNPSNNELYMNKKDSNNLTKWGVKNVFQSEIIKNKLKETNLKKYGSEYATQSDIIKENTKKTNLLKYGVEYIFQSEIIRNKGKETNLKKYGFQYYSQSDISKVNEKKRALKKYGVDNHTKSDIFRINRFIITKDINYIEYIKDNMSLFKCDKGHNFEIKSDNYLSRLKNNIPLCTVCYPIGDQKSIKEKELLEYIKSIYSGEIVSSYKDVLEIDIYLPELKLGFEFNGLYWHSNKFKDKNYHLDKTEYFSEKSIKTIHIWEDDWSLRREIIESQIKNILKINTEKIFARKCYVKEVSIKESKKFLDNNHIQGSVSSQYKIGLYFGEELVSLMTFNSSEGRKKMELGGYNLNRFCNKCGVNVVGGASKLLSYFIKNYDVKRIVSYADKDWSLGNLYEVLGFTNVGGNGPDYKYIIDNQRVHKSRYKKSKLNTTLTEAKQMEKDGFLKIYDCGKLKFEKKCKM